MDPASSASPHQDPVYRAFLHILLLEKGMELGRAADSAIYRYEGAYFLAALNGPELWGPYPDPAALFLHHGRIQHECECGALILEWEGLIVARDQEGYASGPYGSLDDWVWAEADQVAHEPFPRSDDQFPAGRYIHEWCGKYFITVDPFPVEPEGFNSLDSALHRLAQFPLHQAISPRSS